MEVMLNGEHKGEQFFYMEKDDVLLPIGKLQDMGFQEPPEGRRYRINGARYISLKSLAPEVKFIVNEQEAVLEITADPSKFGEQVVDYRSGPLQPITYTESTSAFLNYGVRYETEEDFDLETLSIPFEVGLSIGGNLGFSSFSYHKTDISEEFVRLLSNITHDNPDKFRRYILGDFTAFSGVLGTGGIFGGLSISSNYSLKPYFTKSPGLELTGVLETSSDVEIYVDDSLVKRERLSPGTFNLLNVYHSNGAGRYTIVIRDAFGREEKITLPFYISTVLLKEGLHDYSYNLGFPRENLGQDSFEYDDLTFLGFHRYGFTRSFTAGLRAEADKDVVNGGPTATFLLGRLGEVDAAAAVSYDNEEYGYGGIFSYNYIGRTFNVQASVTGFSEEYTNLVLEATDDKQKLSWRAGAGLNLRYLGSLSGSYSHTETHSGEETKRGSLFYTKTLLRNVQLRISASRTEMDPGSDIDEFFAGLTFFLGRRTSATPDDGARRAPDKSPSGERLRLPRLSREERLRRRGRGHQWFRLHAVQRALWYL
jgi:outer membrane usher protein